MNLFTSTCSACIALTLVTGSALAGPQVKVTFKNLGDTTAIYSPQDSNQFATRNNASPLPDDTVQANAVNTYTVKSEVSPLVNYAHLRYTMGSKSCVFLTTFVATLGFAGAKIPKWNHSATPTGGASCTIRSTGVSLSDYSWSVEMTMR